MNFLKFPDCIKHEDLFFIDSMVFLFQSLCLVNQSILNCIRYVDTRRI